MSGGRCCACDTLIPDMVSALVFIKTEDRYKFFIDTSLESVKGFNIGRQEDGPYAKLSLYLILP